MEKRLLDAYPKRDAVIITESRARQFCEFVLACSGITAEIVPIDTLEERKEAIESLKNTHMSEYLRDREIQTGLTQEELLELCSAEAAKRNESFTTPTGISTRTPEEAQLPIILSDIPAGINLAALREAFYSSVSNM